LRELPSAIPAGLSQKASSRRQVAETGYASL
jgi:hypothetical protein